MSYHTTIRGTRWTFTDLKALLAKASPARSGDALAGIAAQSAIERVAAQMALADLPLKAFLNADLVPYEEDQGSRLIPHSHDAAPFAAVSHPTTRAFREWLLDTRTTSSHLSALSPGLTPEMAAAVSKIMRLQDLIVVADKCSVVSAFRNTIGLRGRLSTRLQPNHPTDDSRGIAASLLDGLSFGVVGAGGYWGYRVRRSGFDVRCRLRALSK
jgi:ethanolamine ammonia-lyase large subunit